MSRLNRKSGTVCVLRTPGRESSHRDQPPSPHLQDPRRTCLDVVQGLHGFPAALPRPQDSGPQAGHHLPGLVLHQRHQGRNDDRDARKHERRELVTERLARACIGGFCGRSALDAPRQGNSDLECNEIRTVPPIHVPVGSTARQEAPWSASRMMSSCPGRNAAWPNTVSSTVSMAAVSARRHLSKSASSISQGSEAPADGVA